MGEELTGQKRTGSSHVKGSYRPLQLRVPDLKKKCVLERPYSLAADSIVGHDRLLHCCLMMAQSVTLVDFAVGAED